MILTVTPTPCVDKTIFIDTLEPGGRFRSDRYTCVAGGKGNNVTRAAVAMGYESAPMVIVGQHPGAHVIDMLETDDDVAPIPIWVAEPTRTVTTVLESNPHRQTAFFEPGPEISDDEYANIIESFSVAVDHASIVTMNGTVSDKRIDRLYADLIPIAKKAGVRTILDTYGPELAAGLEAQPYMVKPNQEEAERFIGKPLDSLEAMSAAAKSFHASGVHIVAISLGKAGAFISTEESQFQVTPPTIDEVNPVGSGDSFVAGFAIGILEGWSIQDTAILAAAMGTANAMSWDIGHFTTEEVEAIRDQIRVTTT